MRAQHGPNFLARLGLLLYMSLHLCEPLPPPPTCILHLHHILCWQESGCRGVHIEAGKVLCLGPEKAGVRHYLHWRGVIIAGASALVCSGGSTGLLNTLVTIHLPPCIPINSMEIESLYVIACIISRDKLATLQWRQEIKVAFYKKDRSSLFTRHYSVMGGCQHGGLAANLLRPTACAWVFLCDWLALLKGCPSILSS